MQRQWLIRIALGSVLLFLLGRAFQHLVFEGPYRAFFLDEQHFGVLQSWLGQGTWYDYVNDPITDVRILWYTRAVGVLWVLCALSFLRWKQIHGGLQLALVFLSTGTLVFYAGCAYLDKGYQSAQWIEHSAQFLFPALSLWFLRSSQMPSWNILARLAIALTFTGHGMYAMGLFPVPGNFVYMTTTILGVSDAFAKDLLYVAGILDLLVSVALFLPKVDRIALWYCVGWGLLTALARPLTYIYFNHLFWITVQQTLFEFVVRIPHFILPLMVLMRAAQHDVQTSTSRPLGFLFGKLAHRSSRI